MAELGNDTVAVVDLGQGKLLRTVTGFAEPQGIAYASEADQAVVANGGDGSVRFLDGGDQHETGRLALGKDADNVRTTAEGVIVGYGDGALAAIDLHRSLVAATIALQGHPESFQITSDGRRAYVNVPDAAQIAVVDLQSGRQLAAWATPRLTANFPMALDAMATRVWVAFRSPARLVAFDSISGARAADLDSCNDSDDVFIDEKRRRLYVVCGGGQIDVWGNIDTHPVRIARIRTASGARTGLFVPSLDRLYVAARQAGAQPAVVLVFRPPL